jgi:hypothetical protein
MGRLTRRNCFHYKTRELTRARNWSGLFLPSLPSSRAGARENGMPTGISVAIIETPKSSTAPMNLSSEPESCSKRPLERLHGYRWSLCRDANSNTELGGYVERAVVPIKATIPVPPRIIDCASCHARLLEKEWLSHACPMRPLEEQDLRALANATKGRAQKTWADLVDWDRV